MKFTSGFICLFVLVAAGGRLTDKRQKETGHNRIKQINKETETATYLSSCTH